MKFTNPWIDPRIADLPPTEAAEAYLLAHGWKPLGPAANPDLLQFEGPGGEDSALVLLPLLHDHGPLLQRMIDLVAEVAGFWRMGCRCRHQDGQHSPGGRHRQWLVSSSQRLFKSACWSGCPNTRTNIDARRGRVT